MDIFTPFPLDKKFLERYQNTEKCFGYVYGIECGDYVKIGSTSDPYTRIPSLQIYLKKYGLAPSRLAITESHVNYKGNEKILHSLFSEKRKQGTELFKIGFSDFLKAAISDKIHFIKTVFPGQIKDGCHNENTVKEKIKCMRTAAGWTRAFVAHQLGVNISTIRNWEKGVTEPSLSMAVKIAKLFGVKIEELLEVSK